MADSPSDAPVVILGAGLAGWTTAREFRKLDSSTPLHLVSQDSADFYAKPALSNALGQKRTPAQLINTEASAMAASLKLTLHARTTVHSLDSAAHSVRGSASDKEFSLAYRRLVLATGAQPIRLPLGGSAASALYSVNSLQDFTAFYDALQPQSGTKTVLLVGAGLIGCEFANDLASAGHSVHVVDPSERALAILPADASLMLQHALHMQGVHWHFGRTLQSLDHAPGAGLTATLSDGTSIAVDAALSAVGLRPNTQLAADAGIALGRGIRVNVALQTSAPDVYALGDCAQYASAGDRPLPFVMPIMSAAKALAATLAGQETPLQFPLMPVTIKTPALPLVLLLPAPTVSGSWTAETVGVGGCWRFLDTQGVQRGFALAGSQTARRAELLRACHA